MIDIYKCDLLVPFHSFLMPELIYLLYSYDLSLKAFSVGLLNLFRLKSRRNKRSEPYYYPFVMESVEKRKAYNPILRNTARYIY